jgi:hypothetical protein
MKTILVFLIACAAWGAPKAQPIAYVTSDPSGACTVGVAMQYNTVDNKFFGCQAETWAQVSGGSSSGGSVFAGSTAVNPGACGATPNFSLADIGGKSPVRFECTLSANAVVGVTNISVGAKFSIAFTQDGTGSRVVSYSATTSNTCTISPSAGVTTTQEFEVGSDGTTLKGVGCPTTNPFSSFPGGLQTPPVLVGALPACSATSEGLRMAVTDSNAASFTAGIGAIVIGVGSLHVPVYCDGTNWRIG